MTEIPTRKTPAEIMELLVHTRADALTALRTMPAESVHLVCTSPPYWGLRQYAGDGDLLWGGRAGCEHEWGQGVKLDSRGTQLGKAVIVDARESQRGAFCARCCAWLGSLGLEPTIELYVEHLVEILHEVRRVLHPSGTVWLNLGDCYQSGNRALYGKTRAAASPMQRSNMGGDTISASNRLPQHGLKDKDLCEIPSRVALALQADGWYLRSRIPWLKRNPMPESTGDRPTSAIEYWFMLAKSRRYYWDGEAVRVKSMGSNQRGPASYQAVPGGGNNSGLARRPVEATRSGRNSDWLMESFQGLILDEIGEPLVMLVNPQGFDAQFCTGCGRYYDGPDLKLIRLEQVEDGPPPGKQAGVETRLYVGFNERWDATESKAPKPRERRYCLCGRHDAWLSHYATYPERCVEPIILAGTSERGCCPKCGEQWRRVLKVTGGTIGHGWHNHVHDARMGQRSPNTLANSQDRTYRREFVRWRPACKCDAGEPIPAVVLDPFAGTGTTLVVAERLGRRAIGIELSADYVRMAEARMAARREPVQEMDAALPLFAETQKPESHNLQQENRTAP